MHQRTNALDTKLKISHHIVGGVDEETNDNMENIQMHTFITHTNTHAHRMNADNNSKIVQKVFKMTAFGSYTEIVSNDTSMNSTILSSVLLFVS